MSDSNSYNHSWHGRGRLTRVSYRRRTRVPSWWPFSWPAKMVDDWLTVENVPYPDWSHVDLGHIAVYNGDPYPQCYPGRYPRTFQGPGPDGEDSP